MMKRRIATIYATLCTLLLVAGLCVVFYFAWEKGTADILSAIVGMAFAFVLTPCVHELGHIALGQAMQMRYVYVKCFCFKIAEKKGKRRLSFSSPFAADQTQMLPTVGGNMQKRAAWYTVGGLLFGGIFLMIILAAALLCTLVDSTKFTLWGAIPYATYLFLLNAAPLEYPNGKTDALIYRGIKKGADAEKCMLSAMEIQGQLAEGKSFAEIEEKYYFDLPQLCEEEPLFAVLLDLRYRYYLDKEEYDRAADCLNRLAQAQAYLSTKEVERLAGELTYMHSIVGDFERATESGKLCQEYLKEDCVAAKRILAAYSLVFEKKDAIEPLMRQAEESLQWEIAGVRKLEEKLLSKLKAE